MPKPDASKFTSVLESVVLDLQTNPSRSLEDARKLVTEKIQSSGIAEEAKAEILKNIQDPRYSHVIPVSMTDRGALLTYLYNSILKYKGLGVTNPKKQAEVGSKGESFEAVDSRIPDATERPFSDPNEDQASGYGGDRLGQWYAPKARLRAYVKQNVGVLKEGESLIVTNFKDEQVFFYTERDSSLVGMIDVNLLDFNRSILTREARIKNFFLNHAATSKSINFITKLAAELAQANPTLVEELEQIKDRISQTRVDLLTHLPQPSDQTPKHPQFHASLRMQDAANYFTFTNQIPTKADTDSYLQRSISAELGLEVKIEIVAQLTKKASNSGMSLLEQLLTATKMYQQGQITSEVWQELQTMLESGDMPNLQAALAKMLDSSGLQAPVDKQSDMIPPPPINLPPPGKKYVWDVDSKQHVLVDAAQQTQKKNLSQNPF